MRIRKWKKQWAARGVQQALQVAIAEENTDLEEMDSHLAAAINLEETRIATVEQKGQLSLIFVMPL